MIKIFVSVFLSIVFAVSTYAQDKLRTLLPPRIYAATGQEVNVYFDNVVLTPNYRNFLFDVNCVKGRQDSARWQMTPKDSDIGKFPFELNVLDSENKKIAQAKSEIVIVSKDAGAGKAFSILIIGDSLTDASVYPNELKKLLTANGNPDVKFIGSHAGRGQALDGSKVPHEGRGGWTWAGFCKIYNLSQSDYKAKSPFLFPDENGKPVLDLKKYLDKYNEGKDAFDVIKSIIKVTREYIENKLDKGSGDYSKTIDFLKTINTTYRQKVSSNLSPKSFEQNVF